MLLDQVHEKSGKRYACAAWALAVDLSQSGTTHKGLKMSNFRAVIDRGHNRHVSTATNYILIADEVAATIGIGRVETSLHRTPSLEWHGAVTGSRAPRSEPVASEPSETEALPPAAAGSFNRSVPRENAGTQ